MAKPDFYLDFANPVFDGTNIPQSTVRVGSKWYEALQLGDFVTIGCYAAKDIVGRAVVIDLKYYSHLEMIPGESLRIEHDASCRTLEGLRTTLEQTYGPEFGDYGLTVITFKVLAEDFREGIDEPGPFGTKDEVRESIIDNLNTIDEIIEEGEREDAGADQPDDREGDTAEPNPPPTGFSEW